VANKSLPAVKYEVEVGTAMMGWWGMLNGAVVAVGFRSMSGAKNALRLFLPTRTRIHWSDDGRGVAIPPKPPVPL